MKIIRLHAENFKRLRAVEIRPDADGALVPIVGPNASGKSSVLDAILAAIGGKGAAPADPVRHGEDGASVTVEVGDYIITRRFKPDGKSDLKVATRDGAAYTSPQKILDGLVGDLTFDPLAFASARPDDQLATLRHITGVDATLREVDDAIATLFAERTVVARNAKAARARAEGAPPTIPDAVDVSAAVTQREAIRNALHTIDSVQAKANAADARRERLAARIADLETQLAQAQADYAEANGEVLALDRELDGLHGALGEDVAATLAALEERIAAGQAQARERESAMQAASAWLERRDEADRLEAEVATLTEDIEALRSRRAKAIADAPMPIPDLSIGEGGVLYRGVPLAQASTAEQVLVSFAVARAMNPTLRVVLIREGSLLDRTSTAALAEAATQHGYQVWLEVVADAGDFGVVIEDGAIAQDFTRTTATEADAV